MCAHECFCVYVVLTESLPERNLEVSHMRGCWYRSGLPSGSSGSLIPCWSCCRGSWKPELLCSLMRPQPGDNGRKALCEEAEDEKEKEKGKGKEVGCSLSPTDIAASHGIHPRWQREKWWCVVGPGLGEGRKGGGGWRIRKEEWE